MKLEGLKICYAMNDSKDIVSLTLTYADDALILQQQFQEMIKEHPECVIKQALVINEWFPIRE